MLCNTSLLASHIQVPKVLKIDNAHLKLQRDCLLTLNDFQKLLGDSNWIRPHLKLNTADLKPLFDYLKSDPNFSSKKKLTNETDGSC